MKEFGQWLSVARQHRGLTQRELAERLEIPAWSIGEYERGAQYPGKQRENKIIQFFREEYEARGPNATDSKGYARQRI